MVSDISPAETALTKKLCAKLVKNDARTAVETKKRMLIIHSACTTDISSFAKLAIGLVNNEKVVEGIMERNIHLRPVLKLELTDQKSRTFTAFRMCCSGEADWVLLKEGQLDKLVEELAPHIE